MIYYLCVGTILRVLLRWKIEMHMTFQNRLYFRVFSWYDNNYVLQPYYLIVVDQSNVDVNQINSNFK